MQRIKELDSIRGLAALAIVVYHLWLPQVGLLGAAVDLFFVLSGFLITTILLTNSLSRQFLVSFYARRALRIWPIYYLSLGLLVLLVRIVPDAGQLDGLPYFATFTQNIPYYCSNSAPAFIPAFRHTWSVAIEEQFYLFWPAVLWVLGRRAVRPAALTLIVLAVMTRALEFNGWILVSHCDGLALGALLASWNLLDVEGEARRERSFWKLGLASTGFWVGSALALYLVPSDWQSSLVRPVQSVRLLSLNVVFLALVGSIARSSGSRWLGVLRLSWLTYLGQISYGLYLYHHVVFMLWDDYAARYGIANNLAIDVAKLALSLAIAALSWRYIEQPALRLKTWFSYETGMAQGGSARADRTPHVAIPSCLDGAIPPVRPLTAASLGPLKAR